MQMTLDEVIKYIIGTSYVPIVNRRYDMRSVFGICNNTTCDWEAFVQCQYKSTYWVVVMEYIKYFYPS